MGTTPAFTPSSIRIPPDLRERLRMRAAINRRSYSSEVLILVERGLAADLSAAEWDERLAREAEFIEAAKTELDAREVVG